MRRNAKAPDAVSLANGPSRREIITGLATGLCLPSLLTGKAIAEPELRFSHVYGETVLDKPASRVVSLGYTTHDALLALGITPLAIRKWFGPYEDGIWPWAHDFVSGQTPKLISGEVSIEIVASLNPDLIIGIGSGISRAEYDVLSQVAPVIMQPAEEAAFGTPWDEITRIIGRATGTAEQAEALISATRNTFTQVRDAHPDWADKTAVCAYHYGGETGAFTGFDTRATFLKELGFKTPEKLVALADPNEFYTPLSPEDLSPLDADLLIWISSFEDIPDIVQLPMRQTLKAHREGRELLAGPLMAGALSFGSVLSLPFALNGLQPEMLLALDGDASTAVPSSVKSGLAP